MMNIKSVASVIALTSLLALSGPAFADTMVGGVSVTDADLPAVQKVCDTFIVDSTSTPAASLADSNANDKDKKSQVLDKNPPGNNGALSIDVTTITADQCKEAGLLK